MKFILDGSLAKEFTGARAVRLINVAVILAFAYIGSLWINLGISHLIGSYQLKTLDAVTSRFLSAPKIDFSSIAKRNIFNPCSASSMGQKVHTPILSTTPTSLNLELLGTIINDNPQLNLAVVQKKGEKLQKIYAISDSIGGNAVVVKIERFAVFIDNGGRMEKLSIDIEKGFPKGSGKVSKRRRSKSNGVRAISAGSVAIERKYFRSQLKDMSKLLVQVRAVPNKSKDGSINGFKLFQIHKGSIYEKIGLKNQDIIKRVNGQDINSAEKGLALFSSIKNDSRFVVDLERNNSNKTLSIEIE